MATAPNAPAPLAITTSTNTLHNFQNSQNSASPGHKRTYQACVREPREPHLLTNISSLLTAYPRYRVEKEKFAANLALSMPLRILLVPDVAEKARTATFLQRGESARRRTMRVTWGKMSTLVMNMLPAMREERALGQLGRLLVTRPGCRIPGDQ